MPFYESFGFVRVGAVSRHQQQEEQVMTHPFLRVSASSWQCAMLNRSSFVSLALLCLSLQQPKAGKDASRNNRRGRNDGGHRTTRRTKRSNDDDCGTEYA